MADSDQTPNQYAAGLLRGAATGAKWVSQGGVRHLLVPLEIVERVLATLEGWDYEARTPDDG